MSKTKSSEKESAKKSAEPQAIELPAEAARELRRMDEQRRALDQQIQGFARAMATTLGADRTRYRLDLERLAFVPKPGAEPPQRKKEGGEENGD